MTDKPIKAASKYVSSKPFYLIQAHNSDRRYIVWLRDKIRIRTLLAGFINRAVSKADVKIRIFESPEEFIDYSGLVEKSALHLLMTKYEDVLFHNGYHDFMIRIPEIDEYIVLDEHGLIFIYSTKDYQEILHGLEAEYRPDEKLIYEFDHWHYCLAEGREKLLLLIGELQLQPEHKNTGKSFLALFFHSMSNFVKGILKRKYHRRSIRI